MLLEEEPRKSRGTIASLPLPAAPLLVQPGVPLPSGAEGAPGPSMEAEV